MPDWSSILPQLESSGVNLSAGQGPVPVSGGDISAAWRVPTRNGDLFIKTGPPEAQPMFSAEAEGLEEIAKTNSIRVPAVIAIGQSRTVAFLALEWLSFEAADSAVETRLGEQLAAMHRVSLQHFGWHRDNTIGLTPQRNTPADDWLSFFREQRLAKQLELAASNGFTDELQSRGAQLLKRLPIYFEGTNIEASLLHGDLWSGNWACSNGQPVIFDPAVYFGDRETDIAMTRLFGGFSKHFYDAYESSWPLPDGHQDRQRLYQLYHVLNHLNLFGSAYHDQALRLIDDLL
jgi:protein-ribulosamine 3-kinase